MKAFLCSLLLCFCGIGCARIYRPLQVEPGHPAAVGNAFAASVALQPWGDNSRYEEKALKAHLRVLVLALENGTPDEVEVLRLETPEGTTLLKPEAALDLVKQRPLPYLLYPLIPALLGGGSSSHGSSTSVGPSASSFTQAFVLLGLAIGIPNAVVASHSNTKLGSFFLDQAWSPGRLKPGQAHRGLVFLVCPDHNTPQTVQVIYRNASGEQKLALVCPGSSPLL